ncbi:apolipoprotein D-like [Genypterus blacodes]|uniref:apolipoprotein D-like n=1 Tax=Genypterus blacodes TaxID=154954 RepID=UPI003F76CF54
MKAIQVISLTLLSVLAANAQVIMPGKCPTPAVQENFDAARYLGKWFDIQKVPQPFQKGECSTALYSLKSPGVVGVLNRELLADGTISSTDGSATAKDPSEPAKLEVTFIENGRSSPYWVLSTDYDSHALVYSCSEIGPVRLDFAWILSREHTLPEQTMVDLRGVLASFGVHVDKMVSTKQDLDFCSPMYQ